MIKAADRSGKARMETLSSSKPRRRSLSILKSAISVLCPDPLCRLMWIEKIVFFQVSKELGKYNFSGDFGQKRQVRNKSIVLQAVRIERQHFQKWSDNGRLKHGEERTRASGIIDYMCNKRKQYVQAITKQRCRNRIKLTYL